MVALDDIAQRIPHIAGLLYEHIVSADDADDVADWSAAVLVDQWGRAHALRVTTTIGRDHEDVTIAVLESSVSRLHAELRYDPAPDRWWLRDLGSTNGTFVEGARVVTDVAVGDLQLLSIGNVAFVFILDGDTVAARRVTESIRATAESPPPRPPRPAPGPLRLLAPSSGEGGVVEFGGAGVQLGFTQFALVTLLAERYRREDGVDPEVRGFVRAVDLIADLPWDTAHPADNNVKQLVRRVRRSLARVGLDDVVESRHGFGYRMVIPAET